MRPGQDGRRPSLPSCWMFKTRRRRMDKKGNHSYWAAIFKSLQVYKLNGLGAVSLPCCFVKISLFFVCFVCFSRWLVFRSGFLKSQKLPAELSGRNVGISSRRRRWDGWRETLSLSLCLLTQVLWPSLHPPPHSSTCFLFLASRRSVAQTASSNGSASVSGRAQTNTTSSWGEEGQEGGERNAQPRFQFSVSQGSVLSS